MPPDKSFKDYFRVLGIAPDATPAQIKKAYRDRLLFFHPDYHQNDEVRKGIAEQETKDLNEAYSVLNDDGRRQQYRRVWELYQRGPEFMIAAAQMETKLQEALTRERSLQDTLATLSRELESARHEMHSLRQQAVQLKSRLAAQSKAADEMRRKLAAAEQRIAETQRVTDDLKQNPPTGTDWAQQITHLRRSLNEYKEKNSAAIRREEEARREIARLRVEIAAYRNQVSALEGQLRQRDTSWPVRRSKRAVQRARSAIGSSVRALRSLLRARVTVAGVLMVSCVVLILLLLIIDAGGPAVSRPHLPPSAAAPGPTATPNEASTATPSPTVTVTPTHSNTPTQTFTPTASATASATATTTTTATSTPMHTVTPVPAAAPASPVATGSWVLVADSAADFVSNRSNRKWWYLWSIGQNNFNWQEMRESQNDCARTPNDWPCAICADFAYADTRADLALQWKAQKGGKYLLEWQASTRKGTGEVLAYRHTQRLFSEGHGVSLPNSIVADKVIDWEMFFFVVRNNGGYFNAGTFETALQVRVYRWERQE